MSTPNLAAWHSRINLLLGYQPYQCEVSFYYHVGTVVELDWANRHIRVFTLQALKRLFQKHGFETLAVAGAPSEHVSEVKKLGWLPMILDDFFSRFPSIAGHDIVLCKKR